MRLGQPDLNMAISGKAVRVLEFGLQGCEGRRGDTLVDRREGALIAQGAVSPALGIRPKPRGDAVPMHT